MASPPCLSGANGGARLIEWTRSTAGESRAAVIWPAAPSKAPTSEGRPTARSHTGPCSPHCLDQRCHMHACAEACAARTPIGRAARLRGCSVLSGDGASLARSHARVGGAERTTPAAIVAARAGAAGRLWAPSEPAGPASPAGRAGARGPWVKPEQASAGLRLARSKPGKHLACGPVRPGIWLRRRGLYSLCACAPEARCVPWSHLFLRTQPIRLVTTVSPVLIVSLHLPASA